MRSLAAVQSGGWWLIRVFHEGDQGAHACQFYNLKSDLVETNNLAASGPARVPQLAPLIEKFHIATQAAGPQPNPLKKSVAAMDDALRADRL